MVIAQNQRLARAPSFATDVLEGMLEKHDQILVKRALNRGRQDGALRLIVPLTRSARGRGASPAAFTTCLHGARAARLY